MRGLLRPVGLSDTTDKTTDTLLDLEYRRALGIGLLDTTVMVRVGPPLTLALDRLDLLGRPG